MNELELDVIPELLGHLEQTRRGEQDVEDVWCCSRIRMGSSRLGLPRSL